MTSSNTPAPGSGSADEVPAGTTMWRLLIRLDAAVLSTALAGWLHARTGPLSPAPPRRYRAVIAVDGKTLRRARQLDGRQIHLLSALHTQGTVAAKSNEIPAFAP
ncbi:hypothetical protein ACQP2F_15935 [Actinoplanes sp. CA-030573]|uniref:hypothetical protein n=1 Tax=Actinoplanes sp. CA-030573 TaxID=3239898 RepID=UPI003D8FC695